MKAQATSEFLIVYSGLLMIFLVIFTIYLGGGINLVQAQESVAALRNAQSIAAAINYVYLAGDGSSYKFTLSNVGNEENITIFDYSVTSDKSYASASAPLLNANVNVSSVERGDITIINNEGEIDIQ